jgi:HK97 family phage prohead protease
MDLKFKNISRDLADIKIINENEDDKFVRVSAIVSTWDIDRGSEKIVKGAFAKSIAKKLPKVVWSHDWNETIGKVDVAIEMEKGLYVEMLILSTIEKGREAIERLRNGLNDEFSIGYGINAYHYEKVEEKEILVLDELELFEVSPVLIGMNPNTELIDVKGLECKKITGLNIVEDKLEITFDENQKMLFNIDESLKNFTLNTPSVEGVKVDGNKSKKKIVLIRKTLKQMVKANEFLLKITKN